MATNPNTYFASLIGNTNRTVAGQTVTLGYGKANFSNVLATYACMKVTPPFVRVTAITSGKRHGSMNRIVAGDNDMNGACINGQIEHDNGTVILLQVSWKRQGAALRDGALFMRLRVGAPLYEVSAFVPTSRENRMGDRFLMFSGYADIMNAEELNLLGIQLNRSYTGKFMAIEELEECFTISQLQSESVGRPQLSAIATPTGIELREVPQEPRRRLVLRRPK